MKLVSLNIERNRHYDKIFPFIAEQKPDVICMQEVLEDDVEYLKKVFGMEGIFKPTNNINHINYKDLEGKHDGVAIFSKKIIESGYVYYWGKEEYMAVSFEEYLQNKEGLRSYVLVWVVVEGEGGERYKYVTTHFPVTKEGESSPHQLEILTPFFHELDRLGDFVLAADFNAPRGNETFRRLAEKYTDCIPKHYLTSLDQNLHRVKGLQYMVDGLFPTEGYTASDVSLVDGLSDHMAIVATIAKK